MGLTLNMMALDAPDRVVRFDTQPTSTPEARLMPGNDHDCESDEAATPRCGYSPHEARRSCADDRRRSSTTPNPSTAVSFDGHAVASRSTA